MSKATPVRQQYLDIKKQFPNAIVFFRLGDFTRRSMRTRRSPRGAGHLLRAATSGTRQPMVARYTTPPRATSRSSRGYHDSRAGERRAGQRAMPREVVRVLRRMSLSLLLPQSRTATRHRALLQRRAMRQAAYADSTEFADGTVRGDVAGAAGDRAAGPRECRCRSPSRRAEPLSAAMRCTLICRLALDTPTAEGVPAALPRRYADRLAWRTARCDTSRRGVPCAGDAARLLDQLAR